MDEQAKNEDLELINRFKNGSEDAFDELTKKYASKMFQTAYGLIGSRQDAEEVVQDALVRVYRHLGQFRGDSSFSTWLYRIVVNLSRNKYQWNKRRGSEMTVSISDKPRGNDGEEREDYNVPDSKLEPLTLIQNIEAEKNVIELMKNLPDKLREALILRHIEEMTYEGIAKMLDCNLGTVKSRIARAREAMVEIMKRGKEHENRK